MGTADERWETQFAAAWRGPPRERGRRRRGQRKKRSRRSRDHGRDDIAVVAGEDRTQQQCRHVLWQCGLGAEDAVAGGHHNSATAGC